MPAAAADAERTVGAIWRQVAAEAGGVQRGVALLYRGNPNANPNPNPNLLRLRHECLGDDGRGGIAIVA